ncbi:KRF1 protein, partial [Sapayoa aenigma]|nr:KRF1 protein [Sapayoa aenigma]
LANSCNEPCVRQCQDSTVVIQPSPVVVTLPGPILSSFPQNTPLEHLRKHFSGKGDQTQPSDISAQILPLVPINSGGFDLSCISRRYGGRRGLPC